MAAAPKPTMAGDVLHAGPAGPLLVAATQQRLEPEAAPDEQGAGPRGPAELVAADRQQVGAEAPEVDRHPPDGLRRIDVHEHASVAAGRHHLGDRLDRAHLVVAPLQVDEGRVRTDRGEERTSGRPARASSTPIVATAPARAADSRTAECSIAGTTCCAPRSPTPRQAVAIDSVAPLVKTTSRDRAPRSSATASRASSTATRAVMPSAWIRPGSPVGWSSQRTMRVPRRGPQGRGGRVVEVVAGQQLAAPWSRTASRSSARSSAWRARATSVRSSIVRASATCVASSSYMKNTARISS